VLTVHYFSAHHRPLLLLRHQRLRERERKKNEGGVGEEGGERE
jgi:hypothetical protein